MMREGLNYLAIVTAPNGEVRAMLADSASGAIDAANAIKDAWINEATCPGPLSRRLLSRPEGGTLYREG
jgi:hypothetical protein